MVEVLRFEDLPRDELARRWAVVRFTDDSEGEALRWYSDEVLICEGDLIGKTREQDASLPHPRGEVVAGGRQPAPIGAESHPSTQLSWARRGRRTERYVP